MRKTTCNRTCENQMLTMTRNFSDDSFDSSKQVVSSFNINLTESYIRNLYLIYAILILKNN